MASIPADWQDARANRFAESKQDQVSKTEACSDVGGLGLQSDGRQLSLWAVSAQLRAWANAPRHQIAR